MRTLKKGAITVKLAALIGLIFLTGCGSGSSSNSPIVPLPGNGSGIPGGSGGCVPISSPIPFSGQNIHFDSYNLVGGTLPPVDTWPIKQVGNVMIGGGAGGAGGFGAGQLYGSSMDGTIQFNVFPQNQQMNGGFTGGFAYSTVANVTGTLQLSPMVQQEIMTYLGAYNTPVQYPQQPYQQPYQTAQACVSRIAFNMGYQVNMPYGKVYLYLNNTQHGIVLVF